MRPLTLEFIIITMLWLAEPISEQQHHFVYYTCFDSTNRFWNQRTPGSVSLFVKAPTFPGTLPTEPRELTFPQSPAFSIPKEDTPGFVPHSSPALPQHLKESLLSFVKGVHVCHGKRKIVFPDDPTDHFQTLEKSVSEELHPNLLDIRYQTHLCPCWHTRISQLLLFCKGRLCYPQCGTSKPTAGKDWFL